jgi:chaperonin GroES
LLESGERSQVNVAIGDEVLFSKYGGTDIEVGGVDVKILREGDILAKLVG